MEETYDPNSDGLPDFLRDPRGVLRRRWPWMLLALTAGLAATAAFVAMQPPRYAAEATILVATQGIPESFVRSTVQEDSFQKINAMVGEVLSRNKLAALIDEHQLYPNRRARETMAGLVDKMREDIRIDYVPGLGSSRDERARVFEIGFEAEWPEVAAAVANDLAGLLTDESIRMRSQQARMTTDFLRKELDRSEAALREQDRKITEFREQHRGELPEELPANLARLECLQQHRQSLALQIVDAENRLTLLASQPDSPDAEGSPEARLAELRASLRRAQGMYTDEHPEVVSLRRQVAELEVEVAFAARGPGARPSLIRMAERSLTGLRSQLVQTEAMIREIDVRVARTPARQEGLEALAERETVLRENYLGFLRKVQEAELAQSLESAQQGERFSVLDPAVPPGHPTRARWISLCVGVLASLGFALAAGILIEAIDRVLVTADQVEAIGGELPMLGSVSRIS